MSAFISLEDARQAAQSVYDGDSPDLAKWVLDETLGASGEVIRANGFYAYALKPAGVDTGVRILAFRGTEPPGAGSLVNLQDIYVDAKDIGKEQFASAAGAIDVWLAQQLVGGRSIELVGHSLGGALVQWAINKTNMATVTNIVLDPETGLKATEDQFVSQLHFTTFNAPGITNVLGGASPATDRTSVVTGEHHVVVASLSILKGDPVHLLGGTHIGGAGTQVVGHQVDFSQLDGAFAQSGFFAHTVAIPEYWTAPVVSYSPQYFDLAIAQSFASHYSQLGNTDGTEQGNAEAIMRLALYASALGASLSVNSLGKQAEAAAQLVGLQFDRDIFASTLALPGVGINLALDMLTEAGKTTGASIVQIQQTVAASLLEVGSTLDTFAGQAAGFIENTLVPWIKEIAQGIGNAVSDLLNKIPDVLDLGRTLGFGEYKAYEQAYEQALQDHSGNAALRSALEDAQEIVRDAGETVVVQQGIGPNPFDTVGFDPAAAPPPTVNLNEGQLQALTINLPFEAGAGGQRLKLTLSGPNASGFVLRTDGVELSPDGNAFTLTVPEGQKQLVVGLEEKQDISTSGALTVTAQLVDANDVPTHEEKDEATIALADTGELVDGTGPAINYANGQPTIRYDGDATDNTPIFNTAANHEAYGYGGNDVLNFEGGSAAFNHQIYGGDGHDELHGGAGQDRIYGEAGRDLIIGVEGDDVLDGGGDRDLLKGGVGRDVLYGGLGDDGLDGGSGDDVLFGGEGNDVLSGESIQLGATTTGNDYLDGEAGDDWVLGLRGEDVLYGGTGADHLYGDQVTSEAPNFELAYPGIVTVLPGVAFESVTGGADYLDGGDGDDYLQGDGGDDVLLGGEGADIIVDGQLATAVMAMKEAA